LACAASCPEERQAVVDCCRWEGEIGPSPPCDHDGGAAPRGGRAGLVGGRERSTFGLRPPEPHPIDGQGDTGSARGMMGFGRAGALSKRLGTCPMATRYPGPRSVSRTPETLPKGHGFFAKDSTRKGGRSSGWVEGGHYNEATADLTREARRPRKARQGLGSEFEDLTGDGEIQRDSC